MCRCPTPIIFVYIRRNRSHQHKASSRKNNNSDSDGGAKTHSYRTAKFTRIFRTGKFGCFCLKFISKHSRAPPLSFVQIQQNLHGRVIHIKNFFECKAFFDIPSVSFKSRKEAWR